MDSDSTASCEFLERLPISRSRGKTSDLTARDDFKDKKNEAFDLFFQKRSKNFCGKIEQKFRPEMNRDEHSMTSTFLKLVLLK